MCVFRLFPNKRSSTFYYGLTFNVFVFLLDSLLNVFPISVECYEQNDAQIYDYTNFFRESNVKPNDEFMIEDDEVFPTIDTERNNNFTPQKPLEDFESFALDRGKEIFESVSTNMPKRRKHHKHRHREKRPPETTTPSFQSFFNMVDLTEPNESESNDFVDYETAYNSDNFTDEENYEKPLKELEEFVRDVQETGVYKKVNFTYHDKDKAHPKNDQPKEVSPYLLKMLSSDMLLDPSVQEMMMLPANQPHPEILWPVKKEAVVEGDVNLGGLMMVHSREDSVTCGAIMPQGGIQALEAMLFTLDILNKRLRLVPNVTIGVHILDDCDKDTYGLEMAVDFIKGSISNIDGAEYHCNKTQVKKVISGVVGAASSVTSIQVANLLRLFKIPQVSFFSTSPELSNKQRFEYFSRTIPSDHYQVKAMVDIVRELGWSYVSIIYEESNYGIKAFEELEDLLSKHNICIAIKEKLVKDSGVAEEIAYDNLVMKLMTKPRARGVIIFGSDQEVAGVMRAVRRVNVTGAFSWIGSDGWSARNLVSEGNEPEVEGTLSVQPQANPVKGFQDYFLGLTVDNNERNPWFVEFWEDHFHCRYPNSSLTPYNKKYTVPCTGKEKLTRQNTDFEDQLQFVSDAVMAFAYAIRDMHRELCNGRAGLCEAMKPTKGPELLRYLRKVQFEGLSGDHFRFDNNGDGPARYNIIHFKQVAPNKYRWIKVGEYLEGELKLNMSEIQFKLSQPKPPESVCSLPCEQGQAKQYVEGESCCWHCFNCTQYQIRHPQDETQCVLCPRGTVPDTKRLFCKDIPEVFLRPGSSWAIGAMALSSTGILVTLDMKLPLGVGLADTEYGSTSPVEVLIGAGLFWESLNFGEETKTVGRTKLIPTKFGWVIGGVSPTGASPARGCNLSTGGRSQRGQRQRFVGGVFLRHNDTPVVRASGRELSYVLLAGILMCYCVTFALVLRPTDLVCGMQRFGAGFCFTVVYAALLTKTNRISRIFNAGKQSAKRPSLISPRSQLIICTGLIGVQVLINGVWMVISPARAMHHYPTREDNLLVCDSYVDASYMVAFSYPIVLIVVCTVYAVLTRKIPEAFNESKHIGFTMYTTCVIWLAFVPLYFGTGNHVPLRITSMSVTISLSASVTVACLFSPKLYIILIRPERNVRQSMMPQIRYSAINKSSVGTGNSGAGSMMAAVVVTAATCDQKEKINKHAHQDTDMEVNGRKKIKTEEKTTQTDQALSNGTTEKVHSKSVSSLTSVTTANSGDLQAFHKHQRKNSTVCELPSPQSVIVKLSNNTAVMCSVKPNDIQTIANQQNKEEAHVVPVKNVTFIDEKDQEESRTTSSTQSNNNLNQIQLEPSSLLGKTQNNCSSASGNPGLSNGPAVPANLSENNVKDVAL